MSDSEHSECDQYLHDPAFQAHVKEVAQKGMKRDWEKIQQRRKPSRVPPSPTPQAQCCIVL